MESDRTHKQKVGALGEEIAARFLVAKRFTIITRNYRKKFGEIDVIAKKSGRIYFMEVKTISRENLMEMNYEGGDTFRAEDNVHPWKLRRLSRTIEVYLAENKISDKVDWQFDVVTIMLDVKNKIARIKILKDIIL